MRLYYGKLGVDANWENCIVVINSKGEIIERWTQWLAAGNTDQESTK